MIAEWNQLSGEWATTIIQLLWQGSIAIGLIWGIGKIWPTMPASKRHWLWRLVYLKLFALMIWQTPVNLALLPARTTAAPMPSDSQFSVEIPVSEPRSISSTPLLSLPQDGSTLSNVSQPALPSPTVEAAPLLPSVQAWLSLLWALGVVTCLYRAFRAFRTTKKLRQESESLAGTAVHDLFVELCQAQRLRNAPRLLSHPRLPSPLVVGCLRPCIIIPQPLNTDSFPTETRMILLHELTHVARKDLWWAWLRVAVESFTFFHPLVRIARHQWNLSQEMACDEAVVTRAQVTAPSYQHALLKTLEQGQHQKQISNNLLAVGASGSFRDMKERIIAMNQIKTRGPLYQIAVAALVAAIGLTGVIPYQLVAKSKKDSASDSNLDSAFGDLGSAPHAKDHDKSNQDGFNEFGSNQENTWDGLSDSNEKTILSPVIQGLAEALKSNQSKVRRRVVEALSELEDPAAIPVLVDALKDSDKEVRHEALHGLEKFDNNQAIDAVAELLHSESWKIRNQALEALEDFNHPKAIDVIVSGLKDPHHKNRLKAIDALEDHDHEVSIDVLHDSIHDDHWQVRKEVIEIFGESGSPEAIKPLLHALADNHPEVRNEAFDALEELNLPDISAHVEHLIEIQPDVFADHAHEILEKLQKEKAKKERRRQREQIKETERQVKLMAQRAAERQAMAERKRAKDHNKQASIGVNRPQHAPETLRFDFGSSFDRKNQDQAIQSIVDSVLSQVNARVEEAIAKAMAELKDKDERREKSGLDPFSNDSSTGGDIFRNP